METTTNKVILTGYLGAAPEFKELKNGKAIAKACIATNEMVKDSAGELKKQTTWHQLVFWDKNAHMANDNFKKGNKLKISGKIVENSYKNALGQIIVKTEIQVISGYVMNSKKLS